MPKFIGGPNGQVSVDKSRIFHVMVATVTKICTSGARNAGRSLLVSTIIDYFQSKF